MDTSPGKTVGPLESSCLLGHPSLGSTGWVPGNSCQGLPTLLGDPACSLCALLPWEPASSS